MPILRGYRRIVGLYLQIQKDRRLFGGPSRERTILHRRIPSTSPTWVQTGPISHCRLRTERVNERAMAIWPQLRQSRVQSGTGPAAGESRVRELKESGRINRGAQSTRFELTDNFGAIDDLSETQSLARASHRFPIEAAST